MRRAAISPKKASSKVKLKLAKRLGQCVAVWKKVGELLTQILVVLQILIAIALSLMKFYHDISA